MFTSLGFLLTFLVVTNGLPLETPSEDVSRYFESRIMGGIDAPHHFAPHMAAMIVGEPSKALICGGSIVSKKLVMTAAHCIDFVLDTNGELLPSLEVAVGTNDLRTGGFYAKVASYYNHPKWDEDLIKYDIGALMLNEALVLSETVAIIPLSFDWVEAGEKSYVTGFGLSGWSVPTTLQLLYVETISTQECASGVHQAVVQKKAPAVDPAVEICTLQPPGQGVCLGDSGSGLVQLKTGYQIGIVSWGFPCARGAPDVFTRVAGVRDFIEPILDAFS